MRTVAQEIASFTQQGYRVESQADGITTMVTGKRPNHALHLILSIITLGLWIPVWICITLFGGERRVMIVDSPDGALWRHVRS